MTNPPRKFTFFTLYSIYVLDLIAMVFVYIVFSPLIINPHSHMLASSTPLGMRNLIIGLLFATYPLAQFFAAPILGELSDRFGRKPILLISTLGTALSTALSAIAIHTNHLPLLFISRLLSGMFAGNLTVTQAAVANLAPASKRPYYMGIFAAVGGIGWTIGPFVAAFLSSQKVFALFDFATPFWLLSQLFLLSFLALIFSLKEPVKSRTKHTLEFSKIAPNLLSVFKMKNILPVFLASFLTIFGWMLYQGFLAPYLIEKYRFTENLEGTAYGVSSLFWFLGGLIGSRWLLKHHPAKRAIIVPMFVSGLALFLLLFAFNSDWVWPLMAIANLTQAMVTACFFSLFAELVTPKNQGKIFGSWNASFAFAAALGPFLASLLVDVQINFPYVIAATILILTGLYYLMWYKKRLLH